MDFRIAEHARLEIERRGIATTEVEATLVAPGQIVPEHGEIVCYQSKITREGKAYLLRVMVNPAKDPVLVVTVYRTSKIRKYWQL